jgi:uncharacterized YigZ family protein
VAPGASAFGEGSGRSGESSGRLAAGPARYPVPAGSFRREAEVRRSRFITTLGRAPDEAAARAFVEGVRREFADATHNCWAWVAGPPGSTARVGMSDDGEPQGTAGRPMLNVLLRGGVGEVAAVVTRYYGGVKLGRGGLGRAYAGGVRDALELLPVVERVLRRAAVLDLAYADHDPVRRLLEALDVRVTGEHYGAAVRLELGVPEGTLEELARRLADVTGGAAILTCPDPPNDDSGRSA